MQGKARSTGCGNQGNGVAVVVDGGGCDDVYDVVEGIVDVVEGIVEVGDGVVVVVVVVVGDEL